MKFTEYRFETLSDGFPKNFPVTAFTALQIGRRGLAVASYMAALKLTENDSIVAGREIDRVRDCFPNDIINVKAFQCCECQKRILPYDSSSGVLFSTPEEPETRHFACEACIQREKEKRDAQTEDVFPPPFEEWPEWAKQAFGPSNHNQGSNFEEMKMPT